MIPDLLELQRFVAGALQSRAPIADVPALADGAARSIGDHHALSRAAQLDVYRKQFWLRHGDALLEDYPGFAYVLEAPAQGAESVDPEADGEWDRFVVAYLGAHPPTHPSLRDLGHAVPRFAEAFALRPDRAALARDMARYELLMVELFDMADHAALPKDAFAGATEESAAERPLPLHPSVRLGRFDHDVPELRIAVREGRAPSPEPSAWHRPAGFALFRDGLGTCFERLDPLALELLRILAGDPPPWTAPVAGFRTTLAAACEELEKRVRLGENPDAELARLPAELPAWLSRFLVNGLFAA